MSAKSPRAATWPRRTKRAPATPAPAAGDVVLRDARPADRAVVEALHRALHASEVPLRPSRRAPEAVPAAYVDELMQRRRRRYGGVLLAEVAGAAVAFVAYDIVEEHLEQDSAEYSVTDLFVAPEHRRRGLARQLLAAVEARAAAAGARRLLVTSVVNNAAAHALYAAAGYAPAFVIMEKRVDGGGTASGA